MKAGDRFVWDAPPEHWAHEMGGTWVFELEPTFENHGQVWREDDEELGWFYVLAKDLKYMVPVASEAPASPCQCPSLLLLSSGHYPTCPCHNTYRKTQEPWRFK